MSHYNIGRQIAIDTCISKSAVSGLMGGLTSDPIVSAIEAPTTRKPTEATPTAFHMPAFYPNKPATPGPTPSTEDTTPKQAPARKPVSKGVPTPTVQPRRGVIGNILATGRQRRVARRENRRARRR